MLTSWIRFILLMRYFYTTQSLSLFSRGEVPIVEFEDTSYYFSFTLKANWYGSLHLCDQMGMQLVSVTSSEIRNFLLSYIKANNKDTPLFWTAGTKLVNSREWIWITTAKLVYYTNWAIGEPNHLDSEHAIQIEWKSNSISWKSGPTSENLNFICESLDVYHPERDYWQNAFSDPIESANFDIFNYNKSRYYISKTEQMTYWNAHHLCNALNMELVTIDSIEEHEVLHKYLRDNLGPLFIWTAGTMIINNKHWYWLPSGRMVSFSNWDQDEPDTTDKKQYCLALGFKKNIGLFWKNEDCMAKKDVICEAPNETIQKRFIIMDRTCQKKNINKTYGLVTSVEQYHIGKEKVTYAHAIEKCKSIGLRLVSIQNNVKQHAINKAMKNSGVKANLFWTSGNKISDKKIWRWMSGEIITKFLWKSETSKIRGTGKCLSIIEKEGVTQWYKTPCSRQYYYICE